MTDTTPLPADCGEFAELETREEVIAYLIAVSRAEGWDEVNVVETAARAAGMSRGEMRRVRDVLRRLGYTAVSTMLTELARKAKRTPVTQTGAKR
jgi:hypothetical protein